MKKEKKKEKKNRQGETDFLKLLNYPMGDVVSDNLFQANRKNLFFKCLKVL